MSDAQMKGNPELVMSYMHEFYFESAAMIVTLITVGKMLEARSMRGLFFRGLCSSLNKSVFLRTLLLFIV